VIMVTSDEERALTYSRGSWVGNGTGHGMDVELWPTLIRVAVVSGLHELSCRTVPRDGSIGY